ncbi:gastrula zinc finger protein XlCGF67.1-like [Aphis gossypii]|uniref:gastrula zinc finger protein XlCGF67.1-like n=1 Tax=Aphis gossypii TaxID=80765 RepID=UPI002158BEB1|nr:gastrula zinc finger protein XlCGF67.1-like [Aphis gossypii]
MKRMFGNAVRVKKSTNIGRAYKIIKNLNVALKKCFNVVSVINDLGVSETFTCPKCGRTYDKRPSFAKHYKFCGVDFECEYCVCWKLNKQDFVIVDERYQCPNQCGRSYKALHGVRQHLRYECGVRPKFSCAVCMKCFAYRTVLKIHMATVHNKFGSMII